MKKILLFGILLLIVFVGGCSVVTDNKESTLTAQGTYTIKEMPDEAIIYIGIETLKMSADESKTENSVISDNVMMGLQLIGISKSDISTLNFNIYPEYDYRDGKSELKGYRTRNTIKVDTKDFSVLGKIIDAAVNNGATNIDGVQFDFSEDKRSDLKIEAIKRASEDARKKADALASGSNAKIIGIISVSEQGFNYLPYRVFESVSGVSAMKEAASTQILPQELEVSSTVSVVYKIK